MSATTIKPIAGQYSLRSLLCTTLTVGMVLAYVKLFGRDGLQLTLLGLFAAAIWGGVLGWFSGRLMETLTWSLVGGVLALCCVLSTDRVSDFHKMFWISIGTCGGAMAGLLPAKRWLQRVIWTLVLSLTFILIGWFGGDGMDAALDLLMVLPVLGGLMILVETVALLQQRRYIALDLWAAGIVFAVIAGNFGAVVVWNLWYAT